MGGTQPVITPNIMTTYNLVIRTPWHLFHNKLPCMHDSMPSKHCQLKLINVVEGT